MRPRPRERRFAASIGFPHHVEARHARVAGAPFGFAAQTGEILSAAMGRGLGDEDFAALIEVLEGTAGFRL